VFVGSWLLKRAFSPSRRSLDCCADGRGVRGPVRRVGARGREDA
jgi:hypothetical protein